MFRYIAEHWMCLCLGFSNTVFIVTANGLHIYTMIVIVFLIKYNVMYFINDTQSWYLSTVVYKFNKITM